MVAFAPSNLVPGIGFSPDKLLQGRTFAYHDAHLYRLGANHQQIPVNAPKHPAKNYQRDGYMSVLGNGGSGPNYWPNSITGSPAPDISFAPPTIEVQAVMGRHERPSEDVDFIQPGELYRRVLDETDKDHLVHNIAGHLGGARIGIQKRQTASVLQADVDYGTRCGETARSRCQ